MLWAKGVFPDDLNLNNNSFDIDQFMPRFSSHFTSHGSDINHAGPSSYSTLVGSLEKHMDSTMGNAVLDKMGNAGLEKKGVKNTFDLQDRMRNASPMKTTGESSTSFKPNTAIPTLSLSVIENDNVPLYPSIEEVIAFGGIPQPTAGVRSSTRLCGQPDADMPHLEKAMKNAQSRDEVFTTGQLAIPMYSIVNIPDSEIVTRANRIGVSLRTSAGEIGKSIKGIKMVEEDQILTILKKKNLRMRIKRKVWRLLYCQKFPPFVRI
jgi:hypothetical protein